LGYSFTEPVEILKRLLIAQKKDVLNQSYIIALDEVKAISIKKVYNGIIAGALRKVELENILKIW
jgi:hypothetical protein